MNINIFVTDYWNFVLQTSKNLSLNMTKEQYSQSSLALCAGRLLALGVGSLGALSDVVCVSPGTGIPCRTLGTLYGPLYGVRPCRTILNVGSICLRTFFPGWTNSAWCLVPLGVGATWAVVFDGFTGSSLKTSLQDKSQQKFLKFYAETSNTISGYKWPFTP